MEEKKENRINLETAVFALVILSVFIVSLIMKDSIIALTAAVCGISYTVFAGKGKIYCYFIGMAGTLCYAYLSFKNALFGNCALYALYYFPMEIAGIIHWKKHYDNEKKSVIKTRLPVKNNILFWLLAGVISFVFGYIAKISGDSAPFADAFATVFSIYGMYLTVKRCTEQWDVWFFVNLLSLYAWLKAYLNGQGAFAMILTWFVYVVLAVYFKIQWEKELKNRIVSRANK